MPEETIQEAGAALSNADVVTNWVKDGTKTAEPETVETPAAAATEGEQARGPDGRFLPKDAPPVRAADTNATPTPASTASAVPAPAVPAAGASAQEVQDFIEAQLGEGTFKVPRGVKIPLKRGETIEYATVEELQKRGMLELDYRHKTAEVARQRREHEVAQTRFAADQARVQAREQWLSEQETEMREAQKDPEKWAAYQEMQRLYQENPRFRKVMDDALAKRETEAEMAVYQEREYQNQVQEGVALAASWIEQIGQDPKYAGVNQERVRMLYANALRADTDNTALDPQVVRAIYEQEARYLSESQSPLQKQLADLQAQVEALKASQAAEKHNAKTTHALDRAKTPPVAATGRPPAPATAPKTGRFGMSELAERNQAWASQRD
jgi:hypothetical protein